MWIVNIGVILLHLTRLLLFTWGRVPSVWPGLGDSSRGSASSPGSPEASLQPKHESQFGNHCCKRSQTDRYFPPQTILPSEPVREEMMRGTNQRAARGAAHRTGRKVGGVGLSEGSYQVSASNLGPKEAHRGKFKLYGFTYESFYGKPQTNYI